MPVYLFAGILSVSFAYMSQRLEKQCKQAPFSTGHVPHKDPNISSNKKFRLVLHSKFSIRFDRIFAFFSFFPLFLVSAIRFEVGTDYAGTYQSIYNYVYTDGYHFKLTGETLYALLNRVAMIYSGSDYVGVFMLSSLLICGFTFCGLKNQSENFSYSVLLFLISGVYFWSFNGVRQAIVMAIFIFALQYIQKDKPGKYVLCILVAAGFHTMALLYLPVYFIKKITLSYKSMFIILAFAVLLPGLFRQVVYFLTVKIPIFNVYAARYLESPKFATYTESSLSHTFINLAFMLLFIIIAILYDKKMTKCNLWINLQILALLFALFATTLPLANRISRLFSIAQLLSIPSMTRLISDKKTRGLINLLIVFCFILYSIVTFYILGYHDIFPYKTIFGR